MGKTQLSVNRISNAFYNLFVDTNVLRLTLVECANTDVNTHKNGKLVGLVQSNSLTTRLDIGHGY